MNKFKIGNKLLSNQNSCYLIAEIGINHNGDLGNVFKLIDNSKNAGFDCVKFQKRTPELSTPDSQKNVVRETPWGEMTYLEYKKRIELDQEAYSAIDSYCKDIGIDWTASCWDIPSVEFIEQYDVPFIKIASASLTDRELINRIKNTNKPIILSTGMSTMKEIKKAVNLLSDSKLILLHTTSSYPCPPEELNLNMINTLRDEFPDLLIGYSGHEVGLASTLAAVTLGAKVVERHITLSRAMWGTDQSASIELTGMTKLVKDIKTIELSLGDGIKKVYDSEQTPLQKLRLKNTI
jgi:N-acetylneuraminate synthase